MKNYPAKLLLLGEHTVNIGSQALAMPLSLFSGHWDFVKDRDEWTGKQKQLLVFADYLKEAPLLIDLDITRFKEELSEGLFFDSDIPTGYGVGSSGALVAAIYDRYCMVREGKDISLLKKTLAQMECFFHGTSSGTDPLVCYLNSALLLHQQKIEPVELPEIQHPFNLFLLDTGIERQATPQIEYFLKKNEEHVFRDKLAENYLPAVNSAIQCFINGEWELMFEAFHTIGEFQLLQLGKMIPTEYLEVWRDALDGGYFKLKICGAGGGGFILGLTKNFSKLCSTYPNLHFLKI